MEKVQTFLCDNGLGEYWPSFRDNGWDDISVLPNITDAQLEKCIKKDGHRMKFEMAILTLKSNNTKERGEAPKTLYEKQKQSQLDEHKPLGIENDEPSSARLGRVPRNTAEENSPVLSFNIEGRNEDRRKKLPSEESSDSEEVNNHRKIVVANSQG